MYPSPDPKTPQQIDEFIKYCAESFTDLCNYAKGHNLNVIIETHGGISSHADVVVRLMKTVNLPKITLNLRDVPLSEALKYVAGLAGLELTADEHAFMLKPAGRK